MYKIATINQKPASYELHHNGFGSFTKPLFALVKRSREVGKIKVVYDAVIKEENKIGGKNDEV